MLGRSALGREPAFWNNFPKWFSFVLGCVEVSQSPTMHFCLCTDSKRVSSMWEMSRELLVWPSCWLHSTHLNLLIIPFTGQAQFHHKSFLCLLSETLLFKYLWGAYPHFIQVSTHSITLSYRTSGLIYLKENPITLFSAFTLLFLCIIYLFLYWFVEFLPTQKI